VVAAPQIPGESTPCPAQQSAATVQAVPSAKQLPVHVPCVHAAPSQQSVAAMQGDP
jgi:hypothetical protein